MFYFNVSPYALPILTQSPMTSPVRRYGCLHKDFRAIIEAGFSYGFGDVKENRPIVNTSFGYQFNPHVYLGGGFGVAHLTNSDVFVIPLFVNFRSDFINNKVSPFVDLKAGYSPFATKGGYASIAWGCRFQSLSLSVGTDLVQNKSHSIDTQVCWGLFAKVGIDFKSF